MAPLIETRSTDEHIVRKRIIAEDDEKQSAQSGIAVGGEIDGDLHVEDGDGLAVESGDGVVVEGGRRRPLSRGTCPDSTQREKPVSTEFIEVVVFVCDGWETLPLAQKK
ncbi:hypothetical protein OsJ_34394 [Oryza sativa Japonica Group]|uniref:Uncharacterized protein n=3 Tax=Oryza TaxID=4527 RepID=A0A8J8YNG1_ORYSJ|nr:hypothetical protein LOC_Os11g37380 [Oryza sativa Japonica Group]EAZ18857.1 hypothetical protein OsJ_34394 [Oryza sativa Japonica Group]